MVRLFPSSNVHIDPGYLCRFDRLSGDFFAQSLKASHRILIFRFYHASVASALNVRSPSEPARPGTQRRLRRRTAPGALRPSTWPCRGGRESRALKGNLVLPEARKPSQKTPSSTLENTPLKTPKTPESPQNSREPSDTLSRRP